MKLRGDGRYSPNAYLVAALSCHHIYVWGHCPLGEIRAEQRLEVGLLLRGHPE